MPLLPYSSAMPVGNSQSRCEGATVDTEAALAWFCVQTHFKHEHIAARHLRQHENLEVLNPQIRFLRRTSYGQQMVTEAMFPTYIFARLEWRTSLNRIHYAPGVSEIVHFGNLWPTVPDNVIEALRAVLGPEEVQMVSKQLRVGEKVELVEGAFRGLEAVITRVMPGSQRVAVLMDFLGRQIMVELPVNSVVRVK